MNPFSSICNGKGSETASIIKLPPTTLLNLPVHFDDLYASAEWLIKEGYTRPSRLVAFGGSNGGLLVGAAAITVGS